MWPIPLHPIVGQPDGPASKSAAAANITEHMKLGISVLFWQTIQGFFQAFKRQFQQKSK